MFGNKNQRRSYIVSHQGGNVKLINTSQSVTGITSRQLAKLYLLNMDIKYTIQINYLIFITARMSLILSLP